jgi:hypothetical protein
VLCLPSLAFRYTVFATIFSNSMSSSLSDFPIPGPMSTLSHQNVYFGRGVVERGRWRPRPSPETSIFIAWILITCHRCSLMNWLYYTWQFQVPLSASQYNYKSVAEAPTHRPLERQRTLNTWIIGLALPARSLACFVFYDQWLVYSSTPTLAWC